MADHPRGTRQPLPRVGGPQSMGRASTDGPRRADEESVREELGHMRTELNKLRKDNYEVKERLKLGERESLRKDKQLQELLGTARSGAGTGEALDQLREELQGSLHFKRTAQESRQVLEEKEAKIAAIQQELKATRSFEMEEDVAQAKLEAKALTNAWVEANARKETPCFKESQMLQRSAKALVKNVMETESEVSNSQRKLTTMQDECSKLEQAVKDHGDQIEKLEGKRAEITEQMSACEERVAALSDITEQHVQLFEEVGKLKQKAAENQVQKWSQQTPASKAQPARSAALEINSRLLDPGFKPDGGDSEVATLLWHFRQAALAANLSISEVLSDEDSDSDGRVSAPELLQALSRLQVPGCKFATVDSLIALLGHGNLIGTLDLALAVQLQQGPASPTDEQIHAGGERLAWACRRRRIGEDEVRGCLTDCLSLAPSQLQPRFMRFFCEELAVDHGSATTLCDALQSHRERLARLLPSWRILSAKVEAAVCARFVHEVTMYRDAICPLLQSGLLTLDKFVQEVSSLLGAHWSRTDLELMALLCELSPTDGGALPGAPPVVDGPRIARATAIGGLGTEFPMVYVNCTDDARKECEKAASAPPRRRVPPGHAAVEQSSASSRPVLSTSTRNSNEMSCQSNQSMGPGMMPPTVEQSLIPAPLIPAPLPPAPLPPNQSMGPGMMPPTVEQTMPPASLIPAPLIPPPLPPAPLPGPPALDFADRLLQGSAPLIPAPQPLPPAPLPPAPPALDTLQGSPMPGNSSMAQTPPAPPQDALGSSSVLQGSPLDLSHSSANQAASPANPGSRPNSAGRSGSRPGSRPGSANKSSSRPNSAGRPGSQPPGGQLSPSKSAGEMSYDDDFNDEDFEDESVDEMDETF